ncbi:21376_t:CDS:1 [Dentiscutata erythropus]|uniref:21376_t:CDS:1 n=1 Tax=Dentiscutata erythropus TaxID=1348616 RepID=A0A9N9AVA6_9GLOM|nr:21376_t:CDS:1 [Dentiscutata erythropus]
MSHYQSPHVSQVSTPSASSSIPSKCVSIRLAGVNKSERSVQDHSYTKFKFFPTDSKDDIRHEISKAFSVESFSLVDEREDHIITATWYSLEDNANYSLIKREKRNRASSNNDIDNRRPPKSSKKLKEAIDTDDNDISETDENEDDKSKKRSHAKKACANCRSAKKKCDQESIPCQRCVKHELQCNLQSEI